MQISGSVSRVHGETGGDTTPRAPEGRMGAIASKPVGLTLSSSQRKRPY